jgi:hypothetical protein
LFDRRAFENDNTVNALAGTEPSLTDLVGLHGQLLNRSRPGTSEEARFGLAGQLNLRWNQFDRFGLRTDHREGKRSIASLAPGDLTDTDADAVPIGC